MERYGQILYKEDRERKQGGQEEVAEDKEETNEGERGHKRIERTQTEEKREQEGDRKKMGRQGNRQERIVIKL